MVMKRLSIISSVLMNVDSSNLVKINDFGFYQTESGAYIIDKTVLQCQNYKNPSSKVIDKIYIYDFKYTPQGAVRKLMEILMFIMNIEVDVQG